MATPQAAFAVSRVHSTKSSVARPVAVLRLTGDPAMNMMPDSRMTAVCSAVRTRRNGFHLNLRMRDESLSRPANGAPMSEDIAPAISSGVVFAVQIVGSAFS